MSAMVSPAPPSGTALSSDEPAEVTTGKVGPWWWVPSLYFDQGIPYVIVMTLSVVMYKNLGISNSDIALQTSWLYLPWVLKPLWSPVVDLLRTKRWWILTLQLVIGASLALVAFSLHLPRFYEITIAVLWLVAFSSATHDIAADGFYMLGLREDEQSAFVGVRSTFYRIATIAGQGGLVFLAGKITAISNNPRFAWSVIFAVVAGLFVVTGLYHRAVLPRPCADRSRESSESASSKKTAGALVESFVAFFRNKHIISVVAFLLTFRLGEAQALKLVSPFLLDAREKGGLGLATTEVGLVYGTIGVLALTIGGLLGGLALSRWGLRRMLWIMLLSTHVPCGAFLLLATLKPASLAVIAAALAVEQLGYGFGFSAYMLFMIMVAAEGGARMKTAHYSICTGFMALGMMVPGMFSGFIQERVGYPMFFAWVLLCALPSIVATASVKIEPSFGKKKVDSSS